MRRLRFATALAWHASPLLLSATAVIAFARGVVPVLGALALRGLIDALTRHETSGRWAFAVAATGLAFALLPLPEQYAQFEVRRRLDVVLQSRLFSAVNSVSGLEMFEQSAFHDNLQIAQRASANGPQQVVRQTLSIAQQAITVVSFAIALFVLTPLLALLALLASIPVLINELRLTRARIGAVQAMTPRERRRQFYARLLTDPRAAKEVRLFGLGDWMLQRMLREIREANRLDRAVDLQELRTQCVALLPAATVSAIAILVAVHRTASGSLSVGSLSAVLASITGLQAATAGIARDIGLLQMLLVLLDQLQEVLLVGAEHDAISYPAADPGPLQKSVRLDNVWFRYSPGQPWVLRGVDLDLPAGQVVGLVGVNGAGKSTLVKILTGLYSPTQGRVLWDGQDISEIDPAVLRQRFAVVFQDFMTYDLVAAENIAVGDLTAVDDAARLWDAAAFAGIDEHIRAMPFGLSTMLSRTFSADEDDDAGEDGGVSLSGGQWQRLAIARAALRAHADLLILDEPSSGLDADAEYDISQRLMRLRRRRCTVLISHRLSTVRAADIILVLDRGRVAETGAHGQLMDADGLYARLFKRQASGYAESGPQNGGADGSAAELPADRG